MGGGQQYVYIYIYVHEQRSKGPCRDLHKSGHCTSFRGSRKFRDDIRESNVAVSQRFYVTNDVKISVFRKSRVNFRERSAIVPR